MYRTEYSFQLFSSYLTTEKLGKTINTAKFLIFFLKNDPGLVLNLFLVFG